MKYNFDEIIERRGTNSFKWDGQQFMKEWGITEHFDQDTISLFTADMDIAVPPAIEDAMRRTVDNRIYGYSFPGDDYYNAVINWFQRKHQWSIKREEILYSPGTVFALGVAIRAFSQKGEGVIIQRPVYSPFTSQIEAHKRVVVNNQMLLDDEGYYSVNMDEFEHLAKQKENTLFILCNPHNPTGRIFSKEELQAMAEICAENGVIIIADEIHGDLIRQDSSFTPIVKTTDNTDHIVTCTAINKTFNVAGLHASNIVIQNARLRQRFQETMGFLSPTPFTINAVVAAYTQCDEWLDELKTYFDETIDWVMGFLKKRMPKVKFVRPEGTYIFWMDFRAYGLPVKEIKQRIYVDANVVLESGAIFDPDLGDGFERVCLSSPRPMIKEAFERIARAFDDVAMTDDVT